MSKPAFPVRFLAALVCLLFILAALFFCVQITVNNRGYFYREYTALGHAASMGMSTGDLTDATMRMIEYMEGTAPSIDIDVTVDHQKVSMFNDRERAHMVDVRALYQGFRTFAWIASALFILFLLLHKKLGVSASRAFFTASKVFGVLLAAIAAWVLLDFNSFWTGFHLLFFKNDLWLLDPATSRMINMMPWELFYDIVLRAVGVFVAVWAVLLLLAGVNRRREKRAGA